MFCAVSKGKPDTLNPEEPGLLAGIAEEMRLAHVVVTSVTRDDLSDGGAGVFAQVIKAIHRVGITVEALIPDFQGDDRALRVVLDAGPDVLNHNLETVPRLYRDLRPGASYERSLRLLELARKNNPHAPTKTGVMVGLGETLEEIHYLFEQVAAIDCTAMVIGQYLQPKPHHTPVRKYYTMEEFDVLAEKARRTGIPSVCAGPLVRSSYRAGSLVGELKEHVSRKS